MLLIMWRLSGEMNLSVSSSLITFCPLLGLQGVSTVAGEEHFINKPCTECCARPGYFGAKNGSGARSGFCMRRHREACSYQKQNRWVLSSLEEKNVFTYLVV